MDYLTPEDIDSAVLDKLTVQDYSKKATIEGVHMKELRNMVGEDGDFSEILRLTEQGEVEGFPSFHLRQINRSKMLPAAIKAWHLHFRQDEIQTVRPDDHLVIGLWDVRETSPTKGKSMRFVFGGGKAQILFIPRGVAHGYMNISTETATILYFVSEQFTDGTDEKRLPWDSIPEFWDLTHG